jgi:hypothetical protein
MAILFHCECGRRGKVADEYAGRRIKCPACGRVQRLPDAEEPLAQPAVADEGLCAICQSPLGTGEPRTACPDCQAVYHADCWEENQGCAVYGCSQVPETEKREVREIPVSYWGLEHKPCPKCNAEILAAAVRCRNCGATFASARPEDATEFKQRKKQRKRLPGLQKAVLVLFVVSVLPCLAPFAACLGTAWYYANRDDIQALPGMYAGMGKLALVVSIGQTLLIVGMAVVFALVRRFSV